MKMKHTILVFIGLGLSCSLFAQKEVRQLVRKGNTAYKDSLFIDAEVAYRKAIDATPTNEVGISYYNLGNALLNQSKYQEAIQEFARAADVETDKGSKAQALHNMGVIFQADQQYDKAIEAYKEALRNNPKDDETRYNLALVMKQQESQDQDQEGKDDQEQKDKEQDQNQDEQNKEQDQQQQNQNQNNENKDNKDQQDQNQNQGGINSQELSKDAAEQMLQAILREEKKTQEKVQQQQVLKGKNKLEKEW